MMNPNEFLPTGSPIYALPTWDNSHLFITAESKEELWKRSAFYPAFRLRAKLYKLTLRIRLLLLGNPRINYHTQNTIPSFLKAKGYSHYSPVAVLKGTRGPTQKWILQLENSFGDISAYLKFAVKIYARSALKNEYLMLSNLPEGLAPRPLAFSETDDGVALLLEAIQGKPLPVRKSIHNSVLDYMKSMPFHNFQTDIHPWLQACKDAGAPQNWIKTLSERSHEVIPYHGDFAPWNLIKKPDGKLCAVDWEFGKMLGFPGADLAYYLLQTASLYYQWSPIRARAHAVRTLEALSWLGLKKNEAEALVKLTAYFGYQQSINLGNLPGEKLQKWQMGIWQ